MLSHKQERQALLIFEAALDQPDDNQLTWVTQQCGGNLELEGRVRQLLSTNDKAEGLLTGHFVSSTSTPIPQRVGQYRIIDQLGAGGMGVVYRGERDDGTFSRTVAIKFIHEIGVGPQAVARFDSERQILAAMQHPNIAQMLDGGDIDGRPYLVMEFIEGTPFTHNSAIPMLEQLRRFCLVCEALSYAHNKLVLHRDIKSSNILITNNGEPKLLDFGIAKINSELTANATGLTSILGMPVTPNYCPPEYLAGEPATIAGEVYSMGVLLHELLLGRVPHDVTGLSLPEAFQRVTTSAGKRISCGTKDLDLILNKALHVDPQRRYISVEALRQDVDNFSANRPIQARRDEWAYTARQFARRNKALVAVALTSVVLLLGAAVTTTVAYLESEASRKIAESQTESAEKTLEFFLTAMVAADPINGVNKNPTIEDALDYAEANMQQEFSKEPALLSVIQTAVASIYSGQGKTEKALQYADYVNTRLNEGLPGLDYWRLRIHSRLAQVYAYGSRLEDSIEHAEKLDALLRNSAAPDQQAIANNLATLGSAQASNGQYQAAIEVYNKVLQLNEKYGAIAPLIMAQTENGLATIYYTQAELELAEQHISRAIEFMEKAGQSETINGLRTTNNWAMLLASLGQFERAEEIFETSIPKLKALVGPSHPILLWDVTNYGRTYHLAGRPEKTVELLEPYLQTINEGIVTDETTTAFFIGKLGYSMCDSKKANDGFVLAERLMKLSASIYAVGHPSIGEAKALAGFCLFKLNRFQEAEIALLEGKQIYANALGADHQTVQHTQEWLDELYSARDGQESE